MSKHNIDGQRAERHIEIRELVHMHQELDMPTERLNTVGETYDALDRELPLALAHIHNIEACATNTRRMHRFKLSCRRGVGNNGDATERWTCGFHAGQHGGVVGAVETWLHQHSTTAAERGKHAAIFRQQRVGRRVNALRDVMINALRPTDMRMAVARE